MSLSIILIGLGQVGLHLAKVLSSEFHDIVAIESQTARCREAEESLDIKVLQGWGTDRCILEAAGIEHADMMIAVTGKDEQNVLACGMASRYGVRQKIARIRNPGFFENPPRFTLADWGVDLAIQPELETAKEIVLLIKRSAATDVLEFAGDRIQLIGIRIDVACPLAHKTLESVSREFPEKTFRVVAILRDVKTIIPGGTDVLLPRDQVFIAAAAADIPGIVRLMGKAEEKLNDIMILGGGRVARSAARLLEEEKDLTIKLIESDAERTAFLADELHRTLVIHGDGRDFDLLAAEGILETDALISATDDEETNILTSLLAKHLGVTKTIALVNRREYIPLMAPIGVNAAVNTNLITSNAILRLVRRGDVISLAGLSGVDAQAVEYLAHAHSRITRKSLNRIAFPAGAIVGAVTRGDQVIIPVGETRIQPGDHVVVFSLPHALSAVDKFFSR
ncbi:MAG TPA: Trk system potassium transporter TrkA [Candidatus Aminicenantes bacterium]|nr:Trk system potassium transporter TrkA [Candidatus Aminicenantes bacterium]